MKNFLSNCLLIKAVLASWDDFDFVPFQRTDSVLYDKIKPIQFPSIGDLEIKPDVRNLADQSCKFGARCSYFGVGERHMFGAQFWGIIRKMSAKFAFFSGFARLQVCYF